MTEVWSRRQLLGAGLLVPGAALLGGCSTGASLAPTARPTPSSGGGSPTPGGPTPAATPPGPAGGAAAAAVEQRLAAQAAAVASGSRRRELGAARRALLGFAQAAHTGHASALGAAAPTAGPVGAGSGSLSRQLARLAAQESAAAARWRRAVSAANGPDAVLWGSLAVAGAGLAAALADAAPPSVAPVRPPAPVLLLSDVAAVQELVRQLHAVVYGYQLAMGRLPVSGRRLPRAQGELRAHRLLRDDLISWLTARTAPVPVAEPAYVPPVVPRDEASAVVLLRRIQDRLQPFCGIWLAAAATPADRARALDALGNATSGALGWGGRLGAWPGYLAA